MAVIEVADSGPGVPQNLRAAIFERFRQAESGPARRHGGTGLGLCIVKDLAELHRGGVSVSNSELGGAAFRVELPLQAPAGAAVHAAVERGADDGEIAAQVLVELRPRAPGSAPATRADAPLVLVIEDNPDMNSFIRGILSPRYRTTSALGAQEGLDRAQELHSRPCRWPWLRRNRRSWRTAASSTSSRMSCGPGAGARSGRTDRTPFGAWSGKRLQPRAAVPGRRHSDPGRWIGYRNPTEQYMTTGNPCILIIEDDFAARKALVDLLQDEGYSVAYAVNGRRTRPWPTFLLQS